MVCINLSVGALHFVTGASYSGPFPDFVNGYLIDIALPFAAYFLLWISSDRMSFLRPWFVKSGIVFAVISSAEVSQYLGRPIFGNTYDPWDFACYAAGALLAAATDKLILERIFGFQSAPPE